MIARAVLVAAAVVVAVAAVAVIARDADQPPQHEEAAPLIAAAGDVACDPADPNFANGAGTDAGCRQDVTAELLAGRDWAAVLALGDLQYEDGALAKFEAVYGPSWGRMDEVVRPVPGNHEYETGAAGGYFDYFNGRGSARGPAGARDRGYYSFEVGDWHLIALNSNCQRVGGCGENSPQNDWLEADLAQHPDACLLAYWHHPRFSSGAVRGDSPRVAPFWQDLSAAGADVVLNSHEHIYERFAPQNARGVADPTGIRQFTVGTGGDSLTEFAEPVPNSEAREASTFGVLELTLEPNSYDWQFLPEAGSQFSDSGSGTC